jgi:hypothetical protein
MVPGCKTESSKIAALVSGRDRFFPVKCSVCGERLFKIATYPVFRSGRVHMGAFIHSFHHSEPDPRTSAPLATPEGRLGRGRYPFRVRTWSFLSCSPDSLTVIARHPRLGLGCG